MFGTRDSRALDATVRSSFTFTRNLDLQLLRTALPCPGEVCDCNIWLSSAGGKGGERNPTILSDNPGLEDQHPVSRATTAQSSGRARA